LYRPVPDQDSPRTLLHTVWETCPTSAAAVQYIGTTRTTPRIKARTPTSGGQYRRGHRRSGPRTSMASPTSRNGGPMLNPVMNPNATRRSDAIQ
jgi:hypothetical protein